MGIVVKIVDQALHISVAEFALGHHASTRSRATLWGTIDEANEAPFFVGAIVPWGHSITPFLYFRMNVGHI